MVDKPQQITLNNEEVTKIIFYNAQSKWGIFAIKDRKQVPDVKGNPDICVTGNFEGVYENCKVSLTANITEHPKYGKQLQLIQYKVLEDTSSKESIINFLTKSTISGIHKRLAEKIYNTFKKDSIHIVLHETERLKTITGIGDKTYQIIKKSVSQYFDMEELLKYCADIGLNNFTLTTQLYKEFGKDAVKFLKENPYQLLTISETLSFSQVDDIAMKSGLKADDDNRLTFGLLYVLQRESILQGSTGCVNSHLKDIFLRTLRLSSPQLYKFALTKLAESKDIYRDDDNIYLSKFYNAEKNVAKILNYINKELTPYYKDKIIQEEIKNFPFTLNIEQIDAIHSCLNHQFSVITGLSGTGKSSISKAVLRIIARHDEHIILLAPTAKAAIRLEECTGYQAQTIHRFLKIKDSSLESAKPVNIPRNSTILVDEVSMLDIRLFEKLLDVIQVDTRIILVGDTHQLPSVQAGNVLEDIINSEKFNICYLTNITRQADKSNIIKYSNNLNEGLFIPTTVQEHDFNCLTVKSTQRVKALEALASSYKKNVEKYGLLNVQVISAYKQGVLGVNSINKILKDVINPTENKDDEIFAFHVGDKVRHTSNDYDLDVYNGETGIVREIIPAEDFGNDTAEDLLVVDFGYKTVKYTKADSIQLTLSFANTVHSSQGSEYDIVYVAIDNEISNILLIRKIIYTAITRAKKKCYIVNVDGCVNLAISNDHYKERLTKLKDFLIEGVSGEPKNKSLVEDIEEIPF